MLALRDSSVDVDMLIVACRTLLRPDENPNVKHTQASLAAHPVHPAITKLQVPDLLTLLARQCVELQDVIEHDDDELYSPVMAMDSLRTLCAIAAGKGYKMQQCDISNAYLQGHLTDRDGNPRYIYLHDPLHRKDTQGR